MEKYMELDNMDAYYEQDVKRKMSSSTISALILSLVVIVVIMVLSIYLSFTVLTWFFPIALIMLGLGIYLIYYILKNSRVEYEYTFVLGELRIARIKGRAKRKNITYFDVKAIDDIGKYINPETGKKNIDASKYPNLLHAAGSPLVSHRLVALLPVGELIDGIVFFLTSHQAQCSQCAPDKTSEFHKSFIVISSTDLRCSPYPR